MSESQEFRMHAEAGEIESGADDLGNEAANLDAGVPTSRGAAAIQGAVVGILIGFRDDGRTPLVIFPGQVGSAALPARAAQDVHGEHIGRQVVLVFEEADPCRPIIVGCMQRAEGWPRSEQAGQVEVESDGERLVVSAKEQLVLRCGKASITLTKAGKVLIHGAYVSNRSSGVMRIRGGSVQIN